MGATSPADGPGPTDEAEAPAAGAGADEAAPRATGATAAGATAAGATTTGVTAAGADKADADEVGAGKAGAGRADEDKAADADEAGEPAAAETRRSRRFSLTRDTARPEGGGRAAGSDAPAPARQWPLLAVLCTAGVGLLIVAADPFEAAFRVGTILIGVALVAGAALRLVVRSVGMLAVRSRFTDLVTYGLLGTLIVLLALVAQPRPWLDIPFLEDAVHFTVR
ncbi:DUF3017 domain-containing protein [Streptomyces sp. NBC_00727]|uniref:DUF3017 domain-containing protein n=1 Tax=Streptomyces sp. NBC_00727 TaxID=2903675 RepID=UPI003864FE63